MVTVQITVSYTEHSGAAQDNAHAYVREYSN